MSSSPSPSTICLPAHILDAHITPRAREVLMLLASQSSAKEPALWICQAAISQRLRCSVATVARAIQKLIEAKLIAETGQLRQGRYKFYHVRWGFDENIKAASKKFTRPIRKVEQPRVRKPASTPFEGVQLVLPPVADVEAEAAPAITPPTWSPTPPPPPPLPPPTLTPIAAVNNSRIAYHSEIARKKHLENLRLHQSMLAYYDRE